MLHLACSAEVLIGVKYALDLDASDLDEVQMLHLGMSRLFLL